MLKIQAQGQQALAELRRVQGGVKAIGGASVSGTRAASLAFGGMRRSAAALLGPLKVAGAVGLTVGAVMAGVGIKSLSAAGDIEALQLRLEGVTSTAEMANRIFKETMKLSIESPFEPQELIDARIGLLNIGLTGKNAITAIGDAAAITQRPLGDLASVMASMETEPLRRLGIELKRQAGSFDFTFRNKMGDVKQITASGVDDARKALLSIFDVKYSGGMGRFASSWKGLISTLSGGVKVALAQFGEGMFPAAKAFVMGINEKLKDLIESGKFKEWGEKIAEKIREAFNFVRAVMIKTKEMWDQITSNGPAAMADALGEVMKAAAQILVTSIVTYLGAMGNIFTGIGRVVGAAMMEQIALAAQSIPGLGGRMKEAGLQAFFSMDSKGRRGFLEEQGIDRATFDKRVDAGDKGLIAKLIASRRGDMMQAGVDDFMKDIPALASTAGGAMAEITRRSGANLRGIAGGVTGDTTFGDLFRELNSRRTMERVTARRSIFSGDNTGAGTMRVSQRSIYAEPGKFKEGDQLDKNTVVIRVEKMVVRANETKKMQNDILKQAGMAKMAVAAT